MITVPEDWTPSDADAPPPDDAPAPPPDIDRLPPQDRDAERTVLGSMLLSKTAVDEAWNVACNEVQWRSKRAAR